MKLKHFITHPAAEFDGEYYPPSLMVAMEKDGTTIETSFVLPLGKGVGELAAFLANVTTTFRNATVKPDTG
jgi:hypothetical protein